MKYIVIIMIIISIIYTAYKITKKMCDLTDVLFDYLEEKRRRKNEKH